MAIKIPQYEDQTTPQGTLQIDGWPRAAPPDTPGYIGQGLQNLGNAGMQFAAAARHAQSQAAIVDSLKGLTDDELNWTSKLKDAFNGAANNGAGVTESVRADFNKYVQDKLSTVQDPALKKHMAEKYNSIDHKLGTTGYALEFKAADSDKYNKFEEQFRSLEQPVMSGQMRLDDAFKQLDTTISNSGLAPDVRNQIVQHFRDRLTDSFNQGYVTRNPQGAKQQLEWSYGARGSYYDMTAKGESNNDPNAVNRLSGASGLFQFMPETWAAARKANPDLPENIKDATEAQQRQAMEWFTNGNAKAMTGDLGRNPTNGELRLAHYFGAKGAVALLGVDPNTKFDDLPSDFWRTQAGAKFSNETLLSQNPNLKGQTVGSIIGKYRQQFDNGVAPDPQFQYAIKNTNPDKIPQWINVAQGEFNRQSAVARAQVENVIADHNTMFMQGLTVQTPLTSADFHRAYGDIEGPIKFNAYQQNMQFGQDVQSLKMMPAAQQAEFMAARRPDPSLPNYAAQTTRYDALVKAVDTVNSQRSQDPIGWAINNGVGSIGQLNMSDASAFGQQLAARTGVAKSLQGTYGTPIALLTKTEQAGLNTAFQKMTSIEKGSYLEAIAKHVKDPEAYRAVMQQMAPDSPVTAMAGQLIGKDYFVDQGWIKDTPISGKQVADLMLQGEALINPSKATKEENGRGAMFPMPHDKDLRAEFMNQVGDAFRGNPEAADYAFQGVKAYYAGKSAQVGDYSGDINNGGSARMKEAVQYVVGGVANPGGNGKVLMPWGMSENKFITALAGKLHEKMAENGLAGTAYDEYSLYKFQNWKDGQYLIQNNGEYMRGADGKPMVIDVNSAPTAQGQPFALPGMQMKRSVEANNVIGQLTAAEKNLVTYHEKNLMNGTASRDDQGRPVTVYSTTIQIPPGEKGAGQFVTVPGYVVDQPNPYAAGYKLPDIGVRIGGPGQPAITFAKPNNPPAPGPTGRVISGDDELYQHWKNQINAGQWPVYPNAQVANQRAQFLHQVMDYDAGNPMTPGTQLPTIPMAAGKFAPLPTGAGLPKGGRR